MARYFHTVDTKGRVIVPSRVRNNLNGLLYVTISLDPGYLSAYSAEQFQSILEQLSQQSGTDSEFRAFRRQFLGSAVACDLDAQGRIMLSEEHLAIMGIKAGDEICFIDMFEKVEICSKAFFESEKQLETPLKELNLERFNVKGL